MSFKHQNDVIPFNAMTDVILQWQVISDSMHFPQAFKTVTFNCFILHNFLAFAKNWRGVFESSRRNNN